jgi:glutamyl-tRNA reductase
MNLILHNLTHHDCPVQVREKAAFTAEQRHSMLRKMHAHEQINEAAVLETCNRLEFYLYTKKGFDTKAFLAELITQTRPDAVDTWCSHSIDIEGRDVVRHLFEVAAGLDSQMLGENQVLAQVKSAYTKSLNCRMSKLVFHRLFHSAFRVGKAVRTHTNINCGAVSIGLAAVELAKTELEMSSATGMVIGAGENAELVAKYLLKAGLDHLILANRDVQNAQGLAWRLGKGDVISLDEISGRLSDVVRPGSRRVDFVISSTAAPEPVVTYEAVKEHLSRRTRPLLIIDIAVPRDIDPRIAEFPCVGLFNIDDLNEQIRSNREKRASEIPKAQAIVSDFTDQFMQWYDSLDLVPTISRLTAKGLELANNEAKRYAGDFGEADSEKLKAFAESLVKKVLHGPISFLKEGGDDEATTEQLQARDLVNKMFLSQDTGG